MGDLKCILCALVFFFAYNGMLAICSFDCNFDYGFCDWKQDKMDDFDWTRWSGETVTVMTGPDSDHTSGEGFYVYIETSPNYNKTTRINNYEARLISPKEDSGRYCLSFWYHMYGSHINRLAVSIKEGFDTRELFRKTGNQGKRWILGQIQFEAKERFQIVIEGKARNHRHSWYGDIAVDDIVIFPTEKCPTDCGDPTPEAGVANSTNIKIGSAVQISCKPGYKILGNSSVFCLVNGSWSDRSECHPTDCGTMKITNGHFNTAAGTTFGKTATQSCDTGYTFAGDETVTCLEAGWNGTIATCTIVDPESSALIAVYVTVPLVVFVTIMLTLVVCRKRPLKCSKASGAQQGENMNPVIQETMKTNNVVNEYEHLNSNTMQTGTGGSALPGNEYAVLSDTENDEVVHVYYSTDEAKFVDKDDDKLGYENVKSFASPFGGMSVNTFGTKCEPNGDETPIQLYECLKTDTQNENDFYDLLNKN